MTRRLYKKRVEDHRIELEARKRERETFEIEKKELVRLLDRLLASVGYLRGRCGELKAFGTDYSIIYGRVRDAHRSLAEVYRRLF